MTQHQELSLRTENPQETKQPAGRLPVVYSSLHTKQKRLLVFLTIDRVDVVSQDTRQGRPDLASEEKGRRSLK
jgi:hypothetical protein